MRCYKLSLDGTHYIVPEDDFSLLFAEVATLDVGEKLQLEIVEIDENEMQNMGEFDGF